MTTNQFIFYLLAACILIFSIMSILDRRILRAAIYLLFVLVAIAALYYMLDYQFLAAIQLILYAGGIVVLIIFSILLTSQINSKLDLPKLSHVLLGLIVAVGGISLSLFTISEFSFTPVEAPALTVDMKVIGRQLLDTHELGYGLPFEVISVLLLATLVGTIFIARKDQR